ncbi:hypothetical protein HOY82DRAFT_613730 [Tuber indicum]|nr:hypothetical protein HOY82DRAFT_613730 [Tuber indicum]
MAAPPGCCSRTRRSTIFHALKTPAEESLYAPVAPRIADLEGVGADGGGRGGRQVRTSVPMVLLLSLGHTRSLLPAVSPLLRSDFHHGGPQLQLSPIYARKRSNHQLTIPLNPVNNHMSDMGVNVFLAAVMPALYARCLSSLTELRKRLGGDWVLGGGEPGVTNGELAEISGQRPPGPDGNALPGARGRSGLRTVVVTGPMALEEKALRLLGDALFIPRVPDIYFKNVHYTPDASTKNRDQPRRLQPDHRYRQTPPDSEVGFERPGHLQRLLMEPSKNHEDLEYSFVAFSHGVDHRTDTKNKISPTMDGFGITPADRESDTPV